MNSVLVTYWHNFGSILKSGNSFGTVGTMQAGGTRLGRKEEEAVWWNRGKFFNALPLSSSAFMGKTFSAALWATGLIVKGELYEIVRCLWRGGKWVKWAAWMTGSPRVSHCVTEQYSTKASILKFKTKSRFILNLSLDHHLDLCSQLSIPKF